MTAPRRSLIGPALATLIGVGALVGLGVWQLQRLAWKEALIAEMTERLAAPPVDLPPPSQWTALKPDDYEYRRVRLSGVFDYAHQALVFRSLGSPHGRYGGPGYLVMTPFRLAAGPSVLVNRGFVPEALKSASASGPAGVTEITGLLRSSEPRTPFTPADDPTRGQWFTRDVEAIAAALAVGPHAPFSVDEDAGDDANALPEGGETVISFPNNHLSYAITWFGMALALAGVFVAYAAGALRRRS